MPFDGRQELFRFDLLSDEGALDTIGYLERGLARVRAGYCSFSFYRPKTWYRRAPKFCMSGALEFTDAGHWEGVPGWPARRLATDFLQRFTRGRSLVDYGTRPFARYRVIRAYRRALEAARAEADAIGG